MRAPSKFTKKKIQQMTLIPFAFLAPSLLGVVIFVLIPFADALRRSFFESISGKFVWFSNYIQIFQNEALQIAVKNTAKFAIVGIPLLMVISLILAVMLSSFKKSGEFFKTVFLTPMAVPVASVVLLWQVFFHPNGLMNIMLGWFGAAPVDFMNSDKAFAVLIFSYIWKNVGYDMILWLAGLSGISHSLYEAAEIDGAGTFAKFRYITLPCLKPTFFITAVLSFINSFKVFREAYLIAGNYPHNSIYMLQHIFNNWFIKLDIQKMCAASVLLVIVILTFIFILQKISGETDNE